MYATYLVSGKGASILAPSKAAPAAAGNIDKFKSRKNLGKNNQANPEKETI